MITTRMVADIRWLVYEYNSTKPTEIPKNEKQ